MCIQFASNAIFDGESLLLVTVYLTTIVYLQYQSLLPSELI